MDCTLDLFPPTVNYPLCTIANAPRLPEHCIEYVRILLWNKEWPFGANVGVDGDDPTHIQWIQERAQERAGKHGISGVTYRLTQGVVKHIIPAVASTNAVVAAACATEAFKLATTCFLSLNNYMLFSDVDGVHTYSYEAERKEDCLSCSLVTKTIACRPTDSLRDLRDRLVQEHQLREPGLASEGPDGRSRTLFMPTPAAMLTATKGNLTRTLADLQLQHQQQVFVNDVTSPNPLVFTLLFS